MTCIATGTSGERSKENERIAVEQYAERSATWNEAARQAVENDIHILGLSSLAAAHLTAVPELKAALKKQGRDDIMIIIGGVVPPQDYDELYKAGAEAIFPPGTVIAAVIRLSATRSPGSSTTMSSTATPPLRWSTSTDTMSMPASPSAVATAPRRPGRSGTTSRKR